ncbi:hypothetical protein KDA_02410 [Dictyobacter alpinus]|uniref:Uncharacterized protein n=1 Tax=Dictyobacter alpinus TaxID=2014873 RepID=A0A402B0B8_9CHLR|nr:hypothetical protein KDA_02410 [Dictyobacter alpinus]
MSVEDRVPEEDIFAVAALKKGVKTWEVHQRETEVSLLLRPGHTASRNILVVLMAFDQTKALVVLRFPRSSLSINRNEYNNSVQLHFCTVLCVKHTILAMLLPRGLLDGTHLLIIVHEKKSTKS